MHMSPATATDWDMLRQGNCHPSLLLLCLLESHSVCCVSHLLMLYFWSDVIHGFTFPKARVLCCGVSKAGISGFSFMCWWWWCCWWRWSFSGTQLLFGTWLSRWGCCSFRRSQSGAVSVIRRLEWLRVCGLNIPTLLFCFNSLNLLLCTQCLALMPLLDNIIFLVSGDFLVRSLPGIRLFAL